MIPEQNRTTDYIFPTLIQVTRHPEVEAFNRQIHKEVDVIRATVPNGRPNFWPCDHYTTMTNEGRLQYRPGFNEFAAFAMECAHYFGDVMGYDYGERALHLNDCWVNAYGPGHSQNMHNHPNHLISAVYFVAVPKGSASLLFYSPTINAMMRPEYTEETPENSMLTPYPPVAGDLVMFDSAVRHSVPLNNAVGERVTIALNFSLERVERLEDL